MSSKARAEMSGFFWTVFALFFILHSVAEGHETKEEKEHTIHSSTAHSHRKSSPHESFERRRQNLAQYLQHFLDEYKYLYEMAEDLKHEARHSNEQLEDESHGMSGNDEHHSKNMNEQHPNYHTKHAPVPEHDEHQTAHRSSSHNEHHQMNHDEKHQLHRDTDTNGNKHEHMVTRQSNAENTHEDHVTRSENSDGEDEEEHVHSGEGEHSGDHEGETEKGVHQNENNNKETDEKAHKEEEKKETQEIHEIEQTVNKEAQKKSEHGDSQRVKKRTSEVEHMVHGNAENNHEEDHFTHSDSDGEDEEGEEHVHSGEGEHSGDHEGETEMGDHQEHDEHKKEIEQMEKEAYKTSSHGDSHRETKRTSELEHTVPQHGNAENKHGEARVTRSDSDGEDEEDEEHVHSGEGEHSGDHEGETEMGVNQEHNKHKKEIKQMEKEAHKKSNHGDNHVEKKETLEMHEIDHNKEELKHEADHTKETRVHSEHSEEVEIEGDIDHDVDEYHGGYHEGYEDGHGEARYHMDTSHDDDDDDDDDSQGQGDVDSYYSHERRRHVREHNGGDLHHGKDKHRERKNHRNDDLQHLKTHQGDTRSELHHGTVQHQRPPHERNNHHEKNLRHQINARIELHHDRVKSPKNEKHLPAHVGSSSHQRMSRHVLDDASTGVVHHRRSSGHEKKMHHNLNDDTHHENADIKSHHHNRDKHHMDTGPRDDEDNEDMHHSSNGHREKMEHHKERETRGESHKKNKNHHVPSHQQLQQHHPVKEREQLHGPQQHHRTRRESPSSNEDIYIDEKDKKKELYTAIFTGDGKSQSNDGSAPNEESRKNRRRRDIFDQLKLEERNFAGMKQDSQSQPDCKAVADQAFVYDRDNCRLCQCLNGKAVCEAKLKSCRSGKLENMCAFVNGEMASEGTAHYDGCNHCICRKREWVCTRLRCHFAQHDYVNYGTLTERTKGIERHIDTCMECDREPVTPVCGPDWRTYRSLCHLRFCGYYDFDEVSQGPCSRVNPCEDAECDVDEICVPFPRGPCLSTRTRDTIHVTCKQYKCVSKEEECSEVPLPGDAVCGQDGHTYPSECHLHNKSIAFAYRGPCKTSCMTGNAQVCGTDGITYQSDCHANLHNRHVDYPGACEDMVAKPEVVNADDFGSFMYVNRRCRKVLENKRCLHPTCKTTVIPEGSCCPVCGAAVSIRVDRAIASDLLGLYLLKPSTDFTSLETIQSFIRGIQDPQHLRKCRMTIDYTERNDLSVLFAPRQPGYIPFCRKAAQDTMDYINSHANSTDPIEAMLAAAVAVELGNSPVNESIRVRRDVNLDLVRMKRGSDHSHDMHDMERNGTATVVTPPFGMVYSVGAYISLYWIMDN